MERSIPESETQPIFRAVGLNLQNDRHLKNIENIAL